jgi:hypothetical protein
MESAVNFIFDLISNVQENYGVNPLIFLGLYFGTVPLFWASIYYLVRNYRLKRSIIIPLSGLLFSQLACYVYLLAAGQDLPIWVYLIITALMVYALNRAWHITRRKAKILEDVAVLRDISE